MMSVARTITATEMHGVNRSAILDIIRREGPISRSQIAAELRVSLPTVMRIVEELISEELVRPNGKKEFSGGRKRPLLEFNAHEHLTIGVDMGASNLYGAVADMAGNILAEHTIRDHKKRGVEIYDLLAALIEEMLAAANKTGRRIRGIGVGAPGITYYDEGIVKWAPSLDWRDFPLKQKLQTAFNLPVILDNDVNLSALGEMWYGAGQNLKNLVLIIISRGIGAGVIIDGAVYRGSHLTAGEIGYLIPEHSALGKKWVGAGATESMAAIPGIISRAKRELQGVYPPERIAALTVDDVFDAFRKGEAWSQPVIEETIDYLAQVVATVSVCFDPDVIVLSGEIVSFSDILIEPILRRINGTIPIQPKLVPSSLGHRAAIMGAVVNILHNTSDFYIVRKLT